MGSTPLQALINNMENSACHCSATSLCSYFSVKTAKLSSLLTGNICMYIVYFLNWILQR